MSDSQIIAVLRAYADYLHVTNFVSDGLRWIGYMIIYGLTTVVNGLSSIFAYMYKLLDFWGYAPFQRFLKTYDPVIWALATIGLLWAGLMMMHNKRVDYHEKGNNFLVAVLLFFGLTFLMAQGTKLITAGAEQAMVNTPSAVSIYQGNITDVYMLDKAGWKTSGGKAKLPRTTNQIKNMEDIKLLSINEKVDTGGWFGGSKASDDGTKILSKQLSMNADGKWELHNMQGAFKIDDNYYRYSWHPWILAANLLLYLITVAIVIFKLVKIIMEINFIGLLAQGAALTDFDSGKRNRQIIAKLRDSFVVAFLLCVILQFYAQFLSFITQAGVGGVARVFAMIGAFLFVLDGPNIIQSVFGIDAGLSSMAQTMTNVMLLARGAGNTTKSALDATKKLGGVAKGLAGKGIVGASALAGFGNGLTKKPELPGDKLGGVAPTAASNKKPELNPTKAEGSDQKQATNGPTTATQTSGAPTSTASTATAQPNVSDKDQAAPILATADNGNNPANAGLEASEGALGVGATNGNGTEEPAVAAPDLPAQADIGTGSASSLGGLGTTANPTSGDVTAPQLQQDDANTDVGLGNGQDYSAPDVAAPEMPQAAKNLVGSKLQPAQVGQVSQLGTNAGSAPSLGTSAARQALGYGTGLTHAVPDMSSGEAVSVGPAGTPQGSQPAMSGTATQPSLGGAQSQPTQQRSQALGGGHTATSYEVPHVSTQSMPRATASAVQAGKTAILNDQHAALDAQHQFNTTANQIIGRMITNKLTDVNIGAHQSLAKSPTVTAVRRAYRVGQTTGQSLRQGKNLK
ncbi:pLS20_p028 family conjugation system transmembrane protein [Lacticaseibacillus paracasei]|uniref:pLS20_p028 family conjugation system transmembrane protein n=1 Tax=Lacticaseibacillus paracasei TaxID=1597 RepID=UPI003CFC3706